MVINRQTKCYDSNSFIPFCCSLYGTNRCPLTVQLLQSLKQKSIPHQFKNLDQDNSSQEYYQLMEQQNLTGDNRIPKVYVKGQVLTRPSVQEIQAIR
ncbi:MAG: glutaredoxin family protein [Microcystaceae cyanobacterium]